MEFMPYNIDNHRAGIWTRQDVAVLSFCGTNDIMDWLNNIDYSQSLRDGVLVHDGCLEVLKALLYKMGGDLKRLVNSGRFLYLTSHSLGGGVQDVFMVNFKHPNAKAYTNGGMRSLAPGAESSIWIDKTRIINGMDPVSHAPLEDGPISGIKYRHVQNNVVLLNYDGTIIEDDHRSAWGNTKEVFQGLLSDAIDFDAIPDCIEDHFMDNYCKILGAVAGVK
jgi:hypothetical protein